MSTVVVEQLVEALGAAYFPPQLEPTERRLVVGLWRLLASGTLVSREAVDALARELQVPSEQAHVFVSRAGERDDDGNVIGLMGLSHGRRPHHLRVGKHRLGTWCAWDGLFLPMMIGEPAVLECQCPASGEPIRVELSPHEVELVEPQQAVVSIVMPVLMSVGAASVPEAWTTFSNFVHFFSSPEMGSLWFEGKSREPRLLSAAEGLELGRRLFSDLLEEARTQQAAAEPGE